MCIHKYIYIYIYICIRILFNINYTHLESMVSFRTIEGGGIMMFPQLWWKNNEGKWSRWLRTIVGDTEPTLLLITWKFPIDKDDGPKHLSENSGGFGMIMFQWPIAILNQFLVLFWVSDLNINFKFEMRCGPWRGSNSIQFHFTTWLSAALLR